MLFRGTMLQKQSIRIVLQNKVFSPACALHLLMHQCFNEAVGSKEGENNENRFLVLKTQMEKKLQQFQFWSSALKIVLDYLHFLRSISSVNFPLYKY